MSLWEYNAHAVEDEYGSFVNWEERFYICPECGEPVYEADWSSSTFYDFLCPICEFDGTNDEEEEDEE